VDPITLAVAGSSIAGGLLQYMNSNKAREASSEQLAKIQDIYSKMQVPNLDGSPTDQPQFDVRQLSPEDYKVLSQYVPEVAQQVKEVAPQVITETGDMKSGRAAQMAALNRLRDVGAGGVDPEYADKMLQASRQASTDAQAKIDAVLQAQARRGLLGSGNQLAAQLQGATSSMDRQAMMGSSAAAESYRNQLQALRDSASLGGQVRSADEGLQAQNASIINAYNARDAQSGQQWQNQRAQSLNEAQRYNQALAQNTANQNTAQNNQYAQYNQQYGNQMAQQAYGNAAAQKAALNSIRQQNFANQNAINQGMAGAYQGNAQNIMQGAADTNAAIGGLASGIGAAAMYQGAQDRADERAKKGQANIY
jgi:hypothetical protein